jgi:hypothetical protein
MKNPAVAIHFRNGLVSSVEVVKDFSPTLPANFSAEGSDQRTVPGAFDLPESQRRELARTKQPKLPLLPSEMPRSVEETVSNDLAILEKSSLPLALYIGLEEVIPGVKIPKRLPADSYYIVMVEWPLRPGDSRVEAYYVGTNKRSKYWFLIERTVDDLSPWTTRYIGTKTTAMVEKSQLKVEEAAILLLKCAWEYEKKHWSTPCFFLVSGTGLLEAVTAWDVADIVWPKGETNEKK